MPTHYTRVDVEERPLKELVICQMLVYRLADINFEVTLFFLNFFYLGTDISVVVKPIVMTFCTVLHICLERVFSRFGVVPPKALKIRNCGPL